MHLSNLCVSTGVPVRVIDDDSVGSSQIDSQTADSCGQQEDKNGFVLQKRQKTDQKNVTDWKNIIVLFIITFVMNISINFIRKLLTKNLMEYHHIS